jgi:hypothetical protein
MDHRSSKREQRREAHGSKAHRAPRQHGPVTTAEKRGLENSRMRPVHEERPTECHMLPEMSGDDDYVRRWLAQTDQKNGEELPRPKTRGKEARRFLRGNMLRN